MRKILTDEQMREIFLRCGFTIKEGHADLKPYVYEAGRAIEQASLAHSAPKLPPLDDELRLILGRPNFMCANIAETLRSSGMKIERKAEHEQAAVIHWMLGFYFSHGDKWAEAAADALKAVARDAPLPNGPPRY